MKRLKVNDIVVVRDGCPTEAYFARWKGHVGRVTEYSDGKIRIAWDSMGERNPLTDDLHNGLLEVVGHVQTKALAPW